MLDAAADVDHVSMGIEEIEHRIESVLTDGSLSIVCQPLLDLESPAVAGYEALARFSAASPSPAEWFSDAHAVGRGTELELLAIERALAIRPLLPPGAYLSFNASPATVLTGAFQERLAGLSSLDDLVLEVTEHAPIDDYVAFDAALCPHRRRGLRLAIDDTGAGFASLRHILRLRPDMIKLDRTITEQIDRDRPTRALAAALAGFALETGMLVVAEGIETRAQLHTMRALGVTMGQGYLLGRPAPLATGAVLAA